MLEPFTLSEVSRPIAMTHSPNRDPLLDKIATTLKQRGLHSAVLTLFEVGQPLVFIGSQFQPALAILWPSAQVQQLAQIMEDPAAVHALMHRLASDEVVL